MYQKMFLPPELYSVYRLGELVAFPRPPSWVWGTLAVYAESSSSRQGREWSEKEGGDSEEGREGDGEEENGETRERGRGWFSATDEGLTLLNSLVK